jgi:23S rRNA (pseudouridine1915-N3)-methyltransferase
LAKITPTDQLILLDENGKNHSSVGFSEELQKNELWRKTLVFVEALMVSQIQSIQSTRKDFTFADDFSHQMVRLFFIEQLYRGFTILKNEPYHHQ